MLKFALRLRYEARLAAGAGFSYRPQQSGVSMRTSASAALCGVLVSLVLTGSLRAQDDPLRGLVFPFDDGSTLRIDGTARAFLKLDERINWSGVESTFGGEAVLRPLFETQQGAIRWRARGEFFLNQPNGSSILSDPVRDLYRANFTVPAFQVFQLALEAERGDWLVRFGRIATPLGRYDVPMLTNALIDAPFLKTEIIGFTETGIFVRWNPGSWSFEAGFSNGEPDLDTNSNKALVARVGYDAPRWSAGVWIKAQDGISSEQQKRFNSFAGFDASVRAGEWTVYAEGLVDQHGLWRDPALLTNPAALGVRSLYGRDVFIGFATPIYGGGFDIGATLHRGGLLLDWNWGAYWPQQIGVPSHDAPVYRATFKLLWSLAPRVDLFAAVISETSRPQPFLELNNYIPRALVVGGQIGF